MTITADAFSQLRKTFTAPAAEQSGVDLLKVATKLSTDASAVFGDADPMSKLDELGKSVDAIDALLSKAVEDKDGNVFISGKVDEQFAVDKAIPPQFLKPKPGEKKPKGKDGDKGKGDDAGTAKGDDGGENTDTAKGEDLSDDVSWEHDLAPKNGPVSRSARMTKGERPIPARRNARVRTEKHERARDRAFGRGEQRTTS